MMRSQARFADRTAMVTGAGRGIGRAVAIALAAEGANVGIMARTPEQCEAVAAEIGERAFAVPGDVTNADSCRRALESLGSRFGRPSVLVNAAGISPIRGRAERQELETFADIIGVNLTGTFTMLHSAAASLADGGAAVVNVASVLGVTSSPLLSAYGASKAALIHITRTLAREWADRNVRVNAICPAYVLTDLTADMLARNAIRASITQQTPMGRLAEMREIVDPLLFLASDEASYITGVALLVDGGMAA